MFAQPNIYAAQHKNLYLCTKLYVPPLPPSLE